ncbi:MAG: 30S ribosomal protein S13 [Patescibacteria group bacterium]
MPRISGVDLPENKKIGFALGYVYGIGASLSRLILKSANVSKDKRTRDLTTEEVNRIQNIVDHSYKTEGNLRREVADSIKRLKEIGAWKGLRHARRLPIHGRTKTNSRTTRGNVRKTMGSGRKPTAQKT